MNLGLSRKIAVSVIGFAIVASSGLMASAEEADYATLTGDVEAGRLLFSKCMQCHTIKEGKNRVGPSLYGVVGRQAGTIEGFEYTDANSDSGITWTEEVLFAYLKSPQGYLPGTRMIFPGFKAPQERADVIAYLKSAAE